MATIFDIYGMYTNRQMQRNQNRATKASLKYNVAQAGRNRATTEEQAPLIPRRAEEDYAARGILEGTDAKSGIQRASNMAGRMIQGAREREYVSQKHLSAFKKNLRHQRNAYYYGLAMTILGTAQAAASAYMGGVGAGGAPAGGGGGAAAGMSLPMGATP